jgi:MYXO-CTERM domain-containing protein
VDEPEGVDVDMAGGERISTGSVMSAGPNEPAPAMDAEAGSLHACGCRTPGRTPRSGSAGWVLAVFAVLFLRRRKLAPVTPGGVV